MINMKQNAVESRDIKGKGAQTTEKILDVAEKLFADFGYEATTLRQIATEIGIQQPSLYKHFSSKDALYEAVLARAVQPLMNELEQRSLQEAQFSQVMSIPAKMLALLSTHPNGARLLQREISTCGSGMNPIAERWFRQLFERSIQFMSTESSGEKKSSEKDHQFRSQALLQILAMMNVSLGYFACAPFIALLGEVNLLDADMLEKQSNLFGQIFKLFLINSEN